MERLIVAGNLEIKGLMSGVGTARKQIAAVRAEMAGLGEDAAALQRALTEVREQINSAHSDLKFEAEQLGNEPPDSVVPFKQDAG